MFEDVTSRDNDISPLLEQGQQATREGEVEGEKQEGEQETGEKENVEMRPGEQVVNKENVPQSDEQSSANHGGNVNVEATAEDDLPTSRPL